jgi:DNA modification methylase
MTVRVIAGDALARLRELPSESVHCAVTSPPFYSLRDYGCAGQIGLEPSPEAYVAALVEVFREVRRVLRFDGTLWLNLGDSYGAQGGGKAAGLYQDKRTGGATWESPRKAPNGTKPKDLIGIPWLVAFALRADGWYLRSEIIWHKSNPMPESVTDRPTCAHEKLFLLAKSPRYFYDAEAIKEPSTYPDDNRKARASIDQKRMPSASVAGIRPGSAIYPSRNKRNVWTITSAPYRGAHFATYPPALVEPCILAGTSERGVCRRCGAPHVRVVENNIVGRKDFDRVDHGNFDARGLRSSCGHADKNTVGWRASCSCRAALVPAAVLDPFAGAGTTGLVAERLGRDAVLIELNEAYATMARDRIAGDRQAAA